MNPTLVRTINFNDEKNVAIDDLEWLLTNGLGGYASAALSGTTTRKYHGLLVAALPVPLGRTVMLNFVSETIRIGDKTFILTQEESSVDKEVFRPLYLRKFCLENGLPIWFYHIDEETIVEKRIVLGHMQNTLHIIYDVVKSKSPFELHIEPFFEFRHHESSVQEPAEDFDFTAHDGHFEVTVPGLPPLYIIPSDTPAFVYQRKELEHVFYRTEEERGYCSMGSLSSPGIFVNTLKEGNRLSFTVSADTLENAKAISSSDALRAEQQRRHILISAASKNLPSINTSTFALELILAADQFVTLPYTRLSDIVWRHARGEEARTIIAGYHWFNDWGRDTMISLEGLTLVTGRSVETKYILQTFMHHLRDGLIPNMFMDRDDEGIYNTADATLWYIHALDRYLTYTKDAEFVRQLLPKIEEIIAAHINGTRFGIRVDAEDGLLVQGAPGYALTWMDAKLGDLIVTPRRGKAVEINALWYNALRIVIEWQESFGDKEKATPLHTLADLCKKSFNQKFWIADKGYLADVVEGENGTDYACRPNQLFAISLKHPILEKEHWSSVLNVVKDKLLTPMGLKSLSADHPDHKFCYRGDLLSRDMAYHQGTVWAWLIGPFVDAWLKQHPEDKKSAHSFLEGFQSHFSEAGIGTINEIFDAQPPFTPRGCISQAWSVAEILRTWVKTL